MPNLARDPQTSLSASRALLERARRVVPSGVGGVRSIRLADAERYPQFFRSGEGSTLIDVDGNAYIDYMASFGAILLGYRHPRVEAAAQAQAALGNVLTFPSERWVELAETLVERIDVADWVLYGKNGSDATDAASRIARAHTGKSVILIADHAYHGFHPWSVPDPTGVPAAYRSHVGHFVFNDVESLETAFSRHRGDVAGLMLAPIKHDFAEEQALPTPDFVAALARLCGEHGALLILDDIRAGFRCHASGLSHHAYGYRPDLICYGKGLGNGHPLSVVVGREALRDAAQHIYFSATHFGAAVPMAAALETLKVYDEEGAFERMDRLGRRLASGLEQAARAAGLSARMSGPPAIPFLRIAGDADFARARRFCGEMALRGVLLHPFHNWFVTAAMGDEDIDRTVEAGHASFLVVAALG